MIPRRPLFQSLSPAGFPRGVFVRSRGEMRLPRSVTPLLLAKVVMWSGMCVYLGYHALHGERGLYAWYRDAALLESAKMELEKVRQERERLEHNVVHLRDGSLDLDLLDEQTRRMMGGLRENEVMILLPRGEEK